MQTLPEEVRRSCPCSQILISSLAAASHIQPAAMGVYKYYQEYNGRPAYYGPGHQARKGNHAFSMMPIVSKVW